MSLQVQEVSGGNEAVWSRGMIPRLGRGGPGFEPRNSPFLILEKAGTDQLARMTRYGRSVYRSAVE